MTGTPFPQTSRQAYMLKPGTLMTDGTIFAGICNQTQVYTMPHDVATPLVYSKDAKRYYRLGLKFKEAVKAVKKINQDSAQNYGHTDWAIPDAVTARETLHKTRDWGTLKGTYNLGSECRRTDRGWYWTKDNGKAKTGFQPPNFNWIIHFTTAEGKLPWRRRPRRLSARLVRQVPVPRP